jgi:hypothetical protein
MKFPFNCKYEGCGALNPLDYAEKDIYRYECVVCGRKNAHAMSRERFEILRLRRSGVPQWLLPRGGRQLCYCAGAFL